MDVTAAPVLLIFKRFLSKQIIDIFLTIFRNHVVLKTPCATLLPSNVNPLTPSVHKMDKHTLRNAVRFLTWVWPFCER